MGRCVLPQYVNNDKSANKDSSDTDNYEKTTLSTTELLGGWIGGICGIATSHPMDTTKVVHQNGTVSLTKTILGIYKTGGLLGFYKGISLPAAMAGIQNALFFGIYANTLREAKRWIKDPDKELTRVFIAGNMAGLGQVICTTPVEIFKVQLQTHGNIHILDVVKNILKYRGIRGFYHGFIPTYFRDGPSGGLQLLFYTYADNFFQQYINCYWSHMISGGLAGAVAFAPMTPFDFLKTRLQADDIKQPVYSGLTDCVRKSYQQVGVTGFWRGFGMSSMRAFVSNSVLFVVYEMYVGESP